MISVQDKIFTEVRPLPIRFTVEDLDFMPEDEFKKYDPILFNLKLVHQGWSEAVLVDETGNLQNPGDYLFEFIP